MYIIAEACWAAFRFCTLRAEGEDALENRFRDTFKVVLSAATRIRRLAARAARLSRAALRSSHAHSRQFAIVPNAYSNLPGSRRHLRSTRLGDARLRAAPMARAVDRKGVR